MRIKICPFLFLLFAMPALASASGAALQLYVFLENRPLEGAGIEVDGRPVAVTNADGAAWIELSPGPHRLVLKRGERTIAVLGRRFEEGEDIQILVTANERGDPPRVMVESSAAVAGGGMSTGKKVDVQKSGSGVLEGQVVAVESKRPLAGALVYLSGIDKPVVTDSKGKFRIDLPAGRYSVSVSARGFNMLIKEGVEILRERPVRLAFEMIPSGMEMPAYVVIEPHVAGSVASAISEERNSAEVSNVLGAEQISRAGDSDVAAALKRVSGLTIVGGQYAYIRGLGERYSNILLNGISVPSPNPTRRVVPLDLFPSAMLDSIKVDKTYSSPLPGEFSGGTINLRTRGVPDEFLFQLSGKIGFVTGTTFDKGLRYKGGDYDWIGVEDGTRDLPGSIKEAISGGTVLRPQTPVAPEGFTPEEMKQFGEDLTDVWDVRQETLPPDGRISMAMGDKYHFGDFSVGFYALGRWDQSWDNNDEIRRMYSTSGKALSLTDDYKVQRTIRDVKTNAYLNLEADYRDDHKIFGRVMLVRQTTDEARFLEGFTNTEGANIRRVRLWYQENELLDWQVGTEHTFRGLNDLWVHFLYSGATASLYAPKERRYRYDEIMDGVYEFSRKADNDQIIYSNMDDQDDSWRLDVKLPFNFFQDRLRGSLAGGYWRTGRNRDSSIRRFRYVPSGPNSRDREILTQLSLEDILVPENIGRQGFQLKEVTRATDNYTAFQKLRAYYTQLDTLFFDTLRLTGGVRIEENTQSVTTFELFNPNNKPIVAGLDSRDVLPGVTLTWLISERQQLRLAWSKTLSRPDFRELSPAPYTDPETDQETVGNPNLQQAEIDNYDARWEYYFSTRENLTFGIFYKEMTNPIEKVLLPGPAGLLQLQNAGNAELYGLEMDFRKNLDFIHPWLTGFYVGGNYTYSISKLTLLPENLQTLTNEERPLQGHSKHIINAQLGYDNAEWGTQATLLYNTFSKRISQVGSLGAPDIYEQPFHQLDFVVRQSLDEHWSVQLRMRNLLDSKVKFTQGGETVREYRRGREFAVSVNFAL